MLDERQIRAAIPQAFTGVELPALGERQSGKVRDFFQLDGRRVLVTTDRLSAFDRILTAVPFKGQVQPTQRVLVRAHGGYRGQPRDRRARSQRDRGPRVRAL